MLCLYSSVAEPELPGAVLFCLKPEPNFRISTFTLDFYTVLSKALRLNN